MFIGRFGNLYTNSWHDVTDKRDNKLLRIAIATKVLTEQQKTCKVLPSGSPILIFFWVEFGIIISPNGICSSYTDFIAVTNCAFGLFKYSITDNVGVWKHHWIYKIDYQLPKFSPSN